MVDLTPGADGKVRARLLDLVPGRSGKAYRDWLADRDDAFRAGVQVATLDPFHGYKNAIDDQLEESPRSSTRSTSSSSAPKPSTTSAAASNKEQTGHRGRSGDPLYGIRMILRCGEEKLTDRQRSRLDRAIAADDAHLEVYIAWQCAQRLRAAYRDPNLAAGRRLAVEALDAFPTCPTPEIRRLGTTLKRWRHAFLAYFDTGRANNGGTEAINGLIELHRRIARSFRNRHNYRLRMLLIAGGLTHPHLKQEEPVIS